MARPLIKPKQPRKPSGLLSLFPQQVRRPGCRRTEGIALPGTGAQEPLPGTGPGTGPWGWKTRGEASSDTAGRALSSPEEGGG